MVKIVRILFLLIILAAGLIGSAGYWLYEHKLTQPFPLIKEVHYTVESGRYLSDVAIDLMAHDLLDYPAALTWVMLARWHAKAHKIKAGHYVITVGSTPQEFLALLIQGSNQA